MNQIVEEYVNIFSQLEAGLYPVLAGTNQTQTQFASASAQTQLQSLDVLRQTYANQTRNQGAAEAFKRHPVLPWCVKLLGWLPNPAQPFASYQDLIKFRLTNPFVHSLVQFIVLAITTPTPAGVGLSQASLFVQSVYNTAPLRWLLFCVVSMTPDVSLPALHVFTAERLFEAGNPLLDNPADASSVSNPAMSRVVEYVGFFASMSMDTLAQSVSNLAQNHYLDGVSNAGKVAEKDPSRRKVLAYIFTMMFISPQLFVAMLARTLPQLSGPAILRISIAETSNRYSLYKNTAAVAESATGWIEILIKRNATLLAPEELCNIFLLLDRLVVDCSSGLESADTPIEAVRAVVRRQGHLLQLRMVDMLQDAFLLSESQSSPSTPLMTSFQPRVAEICNQLLSRVQTYNAALRDGGPTHTNAAALARNPPHEHLVFLLELCGLSFGRQACVEILLQVMVGCVCAGPWVAVPLDTVALTQAELGELNCAYLVGTLRLAWGQREPLRDCYRLALEAVIKVLPNETAVANLLALAVVDEDLVLHVDTSSMTKTILSNQWQAFIALTLNSQLDADIRLTSIHIMYHTIAMAVSATNTLTLRLPESLVDVYFALVTETLLMHRAGVPVDSGMARVHALARVVATFVGAGGVAAFKEVADILMRRCCTFELVDPELAKTQRLQEGSPVAVHIETVPAAAMEVVPTTGILETLRNGGSDNARSVGAGMEFGLIEKKSLVRADSGRKVRKQEGLVDPSEWNSFFAYQIMFLVDSCVGASSSSSRLILAERLSAVLSLRPTDAPPIALPYLAQSASDHEVHAKLNKTPILWEIMSVVAKDMEAFRIVRDVIRILCNHLISFWSRPVSRTSKSFAAELQNTKRVLNLITDACSFTTPRARDAYLLLPHITASDVVVLVRAFYDALTDTGFPWVDRTARLDGLLKRVARRNLAVGGGDGDGVGVELGLLFFT
ncbi:hypothetical protein BC830DRAFT_1095529 [Chytriomyces sp. MP71]|nr:hypothetical protein BC830DRAFT_1095529 [Chytriomyces sp. MP71]